MLKLNKECAKCGDKTQKNVIMKCRRAADGVAFHICLSCRESGNIDPRKLKMKRNKTHTNYEWKGDMK